MLRFTAAGPASYVEDLGLSTNGTQVNGHQIGRRVLASGDVVTFGMARTRVGSLHPPSASAGPRQAGSTPPSVVSGP